MDVAVLIPGIMATRLVLPKSATGKEDEEVWPPTAIETQFGYSRIQKLQDPRVVTGDMIDKVLCFPFYVTIKEQLTKLGFSTSSMDKRLVEFPYDWRKDNFETTRKLADRLDAFHANKSLRIVLIGHSMGGLVARLLMESGTYDSRPWFSSIKLFIALATPHLGAPLALARIMGLDSTLGISGADFARLAANPDFPSGYQLIPAPQESAIWNLASPDVAPLDVYDTATALQLGLDPALVARAKAMHDVLGAGRRPPQVRYFYVAGAGHRTVTRVNVTARPGSPVDHGRSVVTRTADAGDGTVPMYSALPVTAQRFIVVNEHATVFKGDPFRRAFFRLLGGDAGDPIESAAREASDRAAGPQLALSLDSPVQRIRELIELTFGVFEARTLGDPLADSDPPRVASIKGKLVLESVNADDERWSHERDIPIDYSGPSIDRLTVHLPPIAKAGLYRIRFDGSPTASDVARFAVSSAT